MNNYSDLTLLYVEDNHSDIEFFSEALKENEIDIDFKTANNGEIAINSLDEITNTNSNRIIIIILDLNMPRMNGFELLDHLSSHDVYKKIPIIIFTTSNNKDDIELAFQKKANSYLLKPDEFTDLIKLVREIEMFWFNASTLPDII